jgi:hypothetical protein
MAIIHKHTALATPITLLTGAAINSLANNARTLGATAIDNDLASNRQLLGDFELTLSFAVAPTADSVVKLFLKASIDGGVTYPTGSGSVIPSPSLLVATFVLTAQTSQIIVVTDVPMPAGKSLPLLENLSGQAFGSSGNTLRVALHAQQTVS